MMSDSLLTNIIAGLALLVSLVSIYLNSRFNKRQNRFDETAERLNLLLIEREKEGSTSKIKADICANFVRVGPHKWNLEITNRGWGTAKNVRLEVIDENGLLHQGDVKRKFPIPILEHQQSVNLIAQTDLTSPRRAHIKFVWDDDSGTDREKELTPTIS